MPRGFVPSPSFEAELLRSDAVRDLLEEHASAAEAAYRDGVPVDEGDLKASVFSDVAMTDDGYRGRVGATDWKAALVELGTATRSPDGSLRRAIEGLGLELHDPGEEG